VKSAQGFGPLGQVSLEVFGVSGYRLCAINVIFAQIGLAFAYTRTVANTLHQIWGLPMNWLFLGLGILLCLQSTIEKMKGVAWLSIVGLLAFLCIVLCLLRFGIEEIQAGDAVFQDVWFPVQFSGTGACLGPAISAFEGVVVSQHVFAQMKLQDPKPFGTVIIISHVISLLLFAFIGFFGLGTYGQQVEVMIFDNLPHKALEVKLCKYTIVIVVAITFQLQMFPVFSISDALVRSMVNGGDPLSDSPGLAEEIVNRDGEDRNEELSPLKSPRSETSSGQNSYPLVLLTRWFLVILTVMMGAVVTSMSALKLVGGIFFAYCSMILPGAAHLRLNSGELGFLEFSSDIFLIGLGLVAVILTLIS